MEQHETRRATAARAPAREPGRCVHLAVAVLLTALLLPARVGARSSKQRPRPELARPYDKGGAFWQGDLWSPDGRYIASARLGEAAVLTVTVLEAKSRRPLVRAVDVHGFVWALRLPHRLVLATCGTYGRASLVMWDGGAHWRSLRPVRRPDDECFELLGVTPDGRLLYEHDPDLAAESHGARLRRRHWLKLPVR